MNNLSLLMDLKHINAVRLSEMTGVAPSTIRRLMEGNNIATAFKETQNKLATALGVTVYDLVEGSESMKNLLLRTEIEKATEHLAWLMRKTSGEQLYLSVTIFTRDKESKMEQDPEGVPDYYSFRVNVFNEDFEPDFPLMSESQRIYYSADDFGIREVIPFYE